MIKIDWKGKIGYGDIVSPICYAHNVSYKLQTKVSLNFRWDIGPNDRIEKTDPETLWKRANEIFYLCDKQGTAVDLYHCFNDPIDFNHSNYDWNIVGNDTLHNYWRPKEMKPLDQYTVVINSTLKNKITLKQYGKAWKDPAADRWSDIVKKLSKDYNVVQVDYSTPIEDLIEVLRQARLFVGYHGTAAWVAKFMHIPSLIFSDGSLTKKAFPYAVIESDMSKIDSWLQHIKGAISLSTDRIELAKKAYETYMPSDKFINHLHHEPTI